LQKIFHIILCLFVICTSVTDVTASVNGNQSAVYELRQERVKETNVIVAPGNRAVKPPADEHVLHAAAATGALPPHHGWDSHSILWLLLQTFVAGLLAVFTPYMYTIHPFTTGYLTRNVKTRQGRIIKTLMYAGCLIFIFTLLGVLVSAIIKFTGVHKFTEHWIFNLFFFRIFLMLGISFLGAFAFKLPASWINAIANKAKTNDLKGILIMAVTLPAASFSSTFPIIGLVLLMAGNVFIIGPIIGLFGFSVGLALPFVFPVILNIFVKSKSALNNIKVILGFLSLMISLKFVSKTDIALGTNLISRDLFIEIWMGLWAIMGIYMLGYVKLSHDTETERNMYGQDYTSLSRLFIAIVAFVFVVYLLPGMWGAPLHGVSGFLPPVVLPV